MTDAVDSKPPGPRRWPRMAVIAAGVFVAVLGLGLVLWISLPAILPSLIVSRTVCDTGEGSYGIYGPGDCPREVIPERQPDSALVEVIVEGGYPGWIEGGYFFLRATTAQGQIVAELRLESLSEQAQVYLPPGNYTLTMYGRSCGGWCGFLDPPSLICSYELAAHSNETTTVRYDWQTCAAESGSRQEAA